MKKSGVRGPKSEVRKPKAAGNTKESSGSQISKQDDSRLRTSDLGLRTLIIGYGNPLRSDDGFGWHASQLLAQALTGQDVEVLTCHQLTPELAEPLSKCRRAVFIDADAHGKPGEIHRRTVRPQIPTSSAFTHTCTPAGLLASAQQLYGHRPRALVITVSAQTFEFGDALSPVVSAALPKVVAHVCQWIGLNTQTHIT
jgi:hydrogenase maturation protease